MAKKAKTVLLVTSHYPPNFGGVETHLQALVNALNKRGWRIIIATYQPLASKKKAPFFESNKGLIIYRFPWLGFNIVHKLTNYPALEFLYLFPGLFIVTLFTLLKHSDQINVIHSQGLVPTAVAGILRYIFDKRLISSIHNMYFFPKSGIYRHVAKLVFNLADRVLAPTKLAAQELLNIEVSSKKVGLFRYWLNLKVFAPVDKAKAKQKLGFDNFTVFFVGRLIETKGVGVLLKVIKQLKPKIDLVIAGDGPMRQEIEKSRKITKNLNYLGRVENENLPLYYSASDLVLFPSLVDEGWGFVAMEAISCGTPVLAAAKGGLSDVVNPKVGKLIKPNAREYKSWIEYYYKNKKELMSLTAETRRYATKNFGDGNVDDIIRAYEG